jgi:DNA-binding NtrC family response regulator
VPKAFERIDNGNREEMKGSKTDSHLPTLASGKQPLVRSSSLARRGLELAEICHIYDQGILVVDDEEHVRLLMREEFEEAGFHNIMFADRASAAIKIMEERGDSITLIVTNIVGFEGGHEEGLDLVRHLIGIYHGIIGIVFNTSQDTRADEAKALGNERVMVLDYLIKSFDLKPLFQSVRKNIRTVIEKRKAAIRTILP